MTTTRKRYTEEFKREAVKLVTELGYSFSVDSRRLGVHVSLLRRAVGKRNGRRQRQGGPRLAGDPGRLPRPAAGESQRNPPAGGGLPHHRHPFFCDRGVFDYLEEKVIPGLLAGTGASDRVRVWSVGCAAGEEA